MKLGHGNCHKSHGKVMEKSWKFVGKNVYEPNNTHMTPASRLLSRRNCMKALPDWLSDSKKLEVLDVSHNHITELPPW